MTSHPEIEPPRSETTPSSPNPPPPQTSLTTLLLNRHSTRSFHPTPIPQTLLQEVLRISQRSPSNSNLQPWRVIILTSSALHNLSAALLHAFNTGVKPSSPEIPTAYKHYRFALGHLLYGPDGYAIPRSDQEAMTQAQSRNYTFFGVPVGMVVYMESSLAQIDVLSVGMWLQSLCLLFAERGVGMCVEASIAGYGEVVKGVLGLGEGVVVLCGVAVGYEDGESALSKLGVERDGWGEHVEFRR